MSFQTIPAVNVRPDDVIHRGGQDWLVITSKYNRPFMKLFVECVTGNVGEQQCWTFDSNEVVRIHERV